MDELEYDQMIYAYAAGALDSDDLTSFIELKKSGKVSSFELSELQNVISLLPIILEIENPDPKLKDKVARKLYRIRDEILAKRRVDQVEDYSERDDNSSNYKEEVSEEEYFDIKDVENAVEKDEEYVNALIDEVQFRDLKEKIIKEPDEDSYNEEIPAGKRESGKTETPRFEKYEPYSDSYQPLNEFRPVQTKDEEVGELKKPKINWLVITLILLAVVLSLTASTASYFHFKNELKKSDQQIVSLNNQIKSLDDEILRLNKIQRIISILGSKDVRTINLDGTIDNPTGFGKLIIDPETREGLLQLYNMPPLGSNQIYQLWLVSKGQSFSLGVYKSRKEVEYLPVSQLPDVETKDIDSFIVTSEEGEGSDIPKGNVFLSTTVKSK